MKIPQATLSAMPPCLSHNLVVIASQSSMQFNGSLRAARICAAVLFPLPGRSQW
jgi:hypothetical protein